MLALRFEGHILRGKVGKRRKSSYLPWWLAFDRDFEMPNGADILQAAWLIFSLPPHRDS